MTIVLVCGGRDYRDAETLFRVMDSLCVSGVIHGGARGADLLAGEWCNRRNIPCWVFPAAWETYGKASGHLRNAQMLTVGRPDIVVAFPGGRGTNDMMRKSRLAGVPVIEVRHDLCNG
jgi:hypothetical protein